MSLEKSNSFDVSGKDKDKILNFIEQHGYLFDNEILEALVRSKKTNVFGDNITTKEAYSAKFELVKLLSQFEVWLDNSMYEEDKVNDDIVFVTTLLGCIKYSVSKNFTFINLHGKEYYSDVYKLVHSINRELSHIRGRIIPEYVDYPEEVNSAFEDLNATLIHLLYKLN